MLRLLDTLLGIVKLLGILSAFGIFGKLCGRLVGKLCGRLVGKLCGRERVADVR